MPTPRVQLPDALAATTEPVWAALRRELDVVEDFPAEVLAEAERAAGRPALPDLDLTDIPFVTIDPPGSRDLDQALSLHRDGAGFRVVYAIADVAAFVAPGGAIDFEAHRRGQTLYAPDRNVPLHPPVLSEGAASLLPDVVRPALVWTIGLDHAGATTAVDVRRALVRSREQLTYAGAQEAISRQSAGGGLGLLPEIGTLLEAQATHRGAVDLPTPEQEVTLDPDGLPSVVFRAQLPVERWNAQISLLTGMAAARLMLDGDIGLLRTLPRRDPDEVATLRRSALALDLLWPKSESYASVISALDPSVPAAAALLTLASRLLRGADYVAFDGEPPSEPEHSAVAAPYAHCTAPLRRLADRYVGEVCVSLVSGAPVPDWVRVALPSLPETMAASSQRARALDRAAVDLAEAMVLAPRVGEEFDAVVVETRDDHSVVQVTEPAVRAECSCTGVQLGARVRVRLDSVDVRRRKVLFAPTAE